MFGKSKPLKSIVFLPDEAAASFSGRKTVLDVALDNGIDLPHSCGGMGSCGTCRVIVESAIEGLPSRTILEMEIATDRCFEERERLGCQLFAREGMRLRIPGEVED